MPGMIMGTILQRRRLLAPAAALILMATAAPVAFAGDDWCSDDPTLAIKTPGGNNVVVHVTNYALGTQHLPSLKAAAVTYDASSVQGGLATEVTVTVLVPDDSLDSGYAIRSVVSDGPAANPGTIYDDGAGRSGKVNQPNTPTTSPPSSSSP